MTVDEIKMMDLGLANIDYHDNSITYHGRDR